MFHHHLNEIIASYDARKFSSFPVRGVYTSGLVLSGAMKQMFIISVSLHGISFSALYFPVKEGVGSAEGLHAAIIHLTLR